MKPAGSTFLKLIGFVAVVFFIYWFVTTNYTMFLPHNIVLKSSLFFKSDSTATKDQVLKNIKVIDTCESENRCPNFYVITSNQVLQVHNFEYCKYNKISDNIFLVGQDDKPFTTFGATDVCTARSTKLICPFGSVLVDYNVYTVFPTIKKLPLTYYSCIYEGGN